MKENCQDFMLETMSSNNDQQLNLVLCKFKFFFIITKTLKQLTFLLQISGLIIAWQHLQQGIDPKVLSCQVNLQLKIRALIAWGFFRTFMALKGIIAPASLKQLSFLSFKAWNFTSISVAFPALRSSQRFYSPALFHYIPNWSEVVKKSPGYFKKRDKDIDWTWGLYLKATFHLLSW